MKLGLREAIIGMVLLGLPVGAWWLVFRPANEAHAKMREQIQVKESKLRELDKVVGNVGDLKQEIAALQEAIDVFRSRLPSEKEIGKILKYTTRLVKENNLATKSIRLVPASRRKYQFYPSEGQSEQPIIIQMEGSFDGFYAFLQALEQQSRIMRISNLSIKKPKDVKEGKEGFVLASFDMSVFFEQDGKG